MRASSPFSFGLGSAMAAAAALSLAVPSSAFIGDDQPWQGVRNRASKPKRKTRAQIKRKAAQKAQRIARRKNRKEPV